MPRSRMVRPEFFDDEKLAKISRDARLLFIGLWVQSDDYGVVRGNHTWLKNQIFSYEELSTDKVDKWMEELIAIDCIRPFTDNDEKYYWIKNFLKHQKVNRPSDTRNPQPPQALIEGSLSAHEVLIDETETETETEVKQKQKLIYTPQKKSFSKANSKKPIPKDFDISDEVKLWAKEKGFTHLKEHLEWFRDWAVAGSKLYANWDSAFRNAIRGNWAKIDTTIPEKIKPRQVCQSCGAWKDKCVCTKENNHATQNN